MDTSPEDLNAGNINMFLVDYARVEVIKGCFVKELPNRFRNLICCAVVARLGKELNQFTGFF